MGVKRDWLSPPKPSKDDEKGSNGVQVLEWVESQPAGEASSAVALPIGRISVSELVEGEGHDKDDHKLDED